MYLIYFEGGKWEKRVSLPKNLKNLNSNAWAIDLGKGKKEIPVGSYSQVRRSDTTRFALEVDGKKIPIVKVYRKKKKEVPNGQI